MCDARGLTRPFQGSQGTEQIAFVACDLGINGLPQDLNPPGFVGNLTGVSVSRLILHDSVHARKLGHECGHHASIDSMSRVFRQTELSFFGLAEVGTHLANTPTDRCLHIPGLCGDVQDICSGC